MKVLDPGHRYSLACLDEDDTRVLQFVKRLGDGYPGNLPPAYGGTTMQEVLRALIDRARYLNGQIPCAETEAAIGQMETALLLFEIRAKRVKGKVLGAASVHAVIAGSICPVCAHVACSEQHAISG